MSQQRVQKERAHKKRELDTPDRQETTSTHGNELADEMDSLLDEIDGVLEENAQAFLDAFVQKGGE